MSKEVHGFQNYFEERGVKIKKKQQQKSTNLGQRKYITKPVEETYLF